MNALRPETLARLGADLARLAAGTHHDPHGVLGLHRHDDREVLLLYLPGVESVQIDGGELLPRVPDSDFFGVEGTLDLPHHYGLHCRDRHGHDWHRVDPYSFGPMLADDDLARFNAGKHFEAWRMQGAHAYAIDGIAGVRFTVWAPDAGRVSVVGPFCEWDGRRYPMRVRGATGVWELFIPGLAAGDLYKFEIRHRDSGSIWLCSDPYARAAEKRPATASIVNPQTAHAWRDASWLAGRRSRDWLHAPMSIYEVHLGSWRKRLDGDYLNYRELADQLVPYVRGLGFTHVELLPIAEYPLDDSWGYQVTGQFAPTSRHGSPDDLRYFVDRCHEAGLGVLLDWVPGHFPRDAHGLANFDGSALYEYADPRKAAQSDWGTLIFNYERHEVRAFLISSACYWIEEFHFDGLRVDAVASMLYLDFSKKAGEFVPNVHGGNHNLEAIDFLRELNAVVHGRYPGALVIAEESTDWPMVSRPTHDGGLGFSMKWNMGWMHDTLSYFQEDPLYRAHHHEKLTFGMMYAYSENFVLPLSHDEVVHLKRSLLGKMPGDRWQRLANLRLLYTWMWAFPGKKLLFMGSEFGQETEWNFREALPWQLALQHDHAGLQRLIGDLNRLYVGDERLHAREFEPAGFRWLSCGDHLQSVLVFERIADERQPGLIVALNFTPVPRHDYRFGVPSGRAYREIFNSDAERYGGSNTGNLGLVKVLNEPSLGLPCSVNLTLPPLGAVILAPER